MQLSLDSWDGAHVSFREKTKQAAIRWSVEPDLRWERHEAKRSGWS